MRGGTLRHPVRVERATETRNDFGEPIKTWTLLANTRAAIEPLRGSERMIAMQVQSDVTNKITLRWHSAIAELGTKDRIVLGSKQFDIKSVMNVDERNREVQVMATEHR